MRELLIATRSARLAVRDHGGEGPPVLLLHGIRGTTYAFASFRPHFDANHRVVELELRGHGRSTGDSWSWDDAVSDVEAVIEHLEIPGAAVVGFSLGGIVAASYAAAHPEARAVVNIDGYAPGDLPRHVAVDAEAERRLAELRQFRRLRVGGTLTQAELDAELARTPAGDKRDALLRRLRQLPNGSWEKLPPPELELAILDEVESFDLLSVYARIERPLLTVLSLRPDEPPRPDLSWMSELQRLHIVWLQTQLRRLAAARRNLELVEVDVPHHELLDRPAIAAAVRDFLARSD
jgi:pimeloyl-ACP methyl ester carboxylesterase